MKTLPKFVVFRHKLVPLTSIFMLGIDAQMPNVSYMILDLSSGFVLEKIYNHQNSDQCLIPSNLRQNQSFSTTPSCLGH